MKVFTIQVQCYSMYNGWLTSKFLVLQDSWVHASVLKFGMMSYNIWFLLEFSTSGSIESMFITMPWLIVATHSAFSLRGKEKESRGHEWLIGPASKNLANIWVALSLSFKVRPHVHNHSYENDFNFHVNKISFSCESMGTKIWFEKEAKGNSEVAYYT